MDCSSLLINSRNAPATGQKAAAAQLLAGLTNALPKATGPPVVCVPPRGVPLVAPPGLSPLRAPLAGPGYGIGAYPPLPVPQPQTAPDCIDLLKRQQGGVLLPPDMNAGLQRPNYLSPAAPEFFPQWMQSDVNFSPNARPVPPPPDQSPMCNRAGPSPLGERTNLPPEHDLEPKKLIKGDPSLNTTPVKEELSAQRQELEDKIRAMLANGAAEGMEAMSGNTASQELFPEPPEINLENLPANIPSIGSLAHDIGECRRCNFFPNGHCMNGRSCAFCHFTHEKRKLSRRERRERRQERQKEEQENPGYVLSEGSSNMTTPTVTPTAGNVLSMGSSNLTTPTVTPSAGAGTTMLSFPANGYNSEASSSWQAYSEVATPTLTPMVTPTSGLPQHPQPAKIMCSSETQTEEDLPNCIHCGATYGESVTDETSVPEPIPEAGSPTGNGEGPAASDDLEPENEENDNDDEDELSARRIAELGG